jgi:subtilisin
MSERKSVIITFKPKDQRPDRQIDKLDILRRALTRGTRAYFFDATTLAKSAGRPWLEEQVVGYDVDRYEAPIVSAQLTQSEIRALRDDGNVAKVEDDTPCHAAGFGPYPHLRMMQELERPAAETIPEGVKQVRADRAWGISMGKGINVAVLDTGIDFNHPDLKANYVRGVSLVPGTTPMDDQGHGTHCAGVIAAAKNGAGVVGVAPEASLYAVKVLDKDANGLFGWSIAGIDWCMHHGINIISMSLGCESAPAALELICNSAWERGLLIVAGAGNQNGNPVPPQQSNVEYPARYKDVIAVSSIDSTDVIAPNSARGPEVDLCAPGVCIQSTLPGGRYGSLSGTSVACPHVAGVAALAWAAHLSSGITNEQIWNVLASTARGLGRSGRDSSYGYGCVNAEVAVASTSFPPPVMPKREICV